MRVPRYKTRFGHASSTKAAQREGRAAFIEHGYRCGVLPPLSGSQGASLYMWTAELAEWPFNIWKHAVNVFMQPSSTEVQDFIIYGPFQHLTAESFFVGWSHASLSAPQNLKAKSSGGEKRR